jgi:hypothetical protein
MSFWTAQVVIIAIIAFTAMRIARYRAGLGDPPRRRGMVSGPIIEALSAQSAQRESELQKEVEDLRERIAVLERIATDANSTSQRRTQSIADEIESLRGS